MHTAEGTQGTLPTPTHTKVRDPDAQWYESGTHVRLIDTPGVYGAVWESIWNLGVCDVHFRLPDGQLTMAPQHHLEECTPDGQTL